MISAKALKVNGNSSFWEVDSGGRFRPRSLSLSEIMTILIAFHQSCYRNFKTYYQEKVQAEWADAFPGLVSYQRFIEWVPGTLVPMCANFALVFWQV